jgi:hypothetical protein
VSFDESVVFATVVAIWIPAWAASPDGTCTNTAGKDAVNALKISKSRSHPVSAYSPWKLKSAQFLNCRAIQSRIKMPTDADGKCPQRTSNLTLRKMHRREISHHIPNPTNQDHHRKLFRTRLINHQETKRECRHLGYSQ